MMRQLKSTNIALAIFLNVITLWLYSIVWLYLQHRDLDHFAKRSKVPNLIVISCLILWFLSWTYANGVWFLYWVVKLFLLFELRTRIHKLCEISHRSKYWISSIWLFFLGSYT